MSGKPAPPKRRDRSIDLLAATDVEFGNFVAMRRPDCKGVIDRFQREASLFRRGRCGGPKGSRTEACGYFFISECSFDLWHEAVLHIKVVPKDSPPRVFFRIWKNGGIEAKPFSEDQWNSLKSGGPEQPNMKSLELATDAEVEHAIELTVLAKKTFAEQFDLSKDRS
jgi:hypothetical protein